MIVYTGKQFWNDFNNWDEGLFQDANRPRDNNKFKIRPWLQSDKWKQRDVNKDVGVDAAELLWWGQKTVWGGGTFPDGFTFPKLQEKIRKGNPWCIINSDWNIEIVENWTYIIEAACQFIYTSNPSNTVIESVILSKLVDWKREAVVQNQWRACLKSDQIIASITGWYSKWGIFNVAAAHSSSGDVTLYEVMNVHRL